MQEIKKNYHRIMLDEIKKNVEGKDRKKLLLHSCCAPCSTYVIKFLSEFFDLEVFFFNPNIYPMEEYMKRMEEQKRLIVEMGFDYKVVENDHKSELFYEAIKGYEQLGEGSERCLKCFYLRLGETARYAVENGFDYWTTTLTISPMKNSKVLNELGEKIEAETGAKFLNSDFKKNNGYKASTEISKEFGLYRQDYCGCVFSKREREESKIEN